MKLNKDEIIELVKILKDTYPDATCSLDFNTPFQMVIAVMLSAQCTDERVNKVTPTLFERCPTPEDFVNIDILELEELIHSCGFYKNKAKNIKACAKKIIDDFNRKSTLYNGRIDNSSWRWKKMCKCYYA